MCVVACLGSSACEMCESVTGKLITGAKILCPPSAESFHLVVGQLVPTAGDEMSEDEDEDMEEPDVTEMESAAELDDADEAQPLKASS